MYFCTVTRSLLRRCSCSPQTVVQTDAPLHRSLSSYYNNKSSERRSWVPRPLRRLFYRYPRAPLGIAIVGALLIVFEPWMREVYIYATTNEEQRLRRQIEKRALFEQRARFGTNFWVPLVGTVNLVSPEVADRKKKAYDLAMEERRKEHAAKQARQDAAE